MPGGGLDPPTRGFSVFRSNPLREAETTLGGGIELLTQGFLVRLSLNPLLDAI